MTGIRRESGKRGKPTPHRQCRRDNTHAVKPISRPRNGDADCAVKNHKSQAL